MFGSAIFTMAFSFRIAARFNISFSIVSLALCSTAAQWLLAGAGTFYAEFACVPVFSHLGSPASSHSPKICKKVKLISYS